MCSGPSARSCLTICLSVLWICYGATHALMNPDFETVPNRVWLTDGPNTRRLAQGDKPSVVTGARQNRYGHIGDTDGRGANGENFSRIFQAFVCQDTLTTGEHCTVTFRFRSLLLKGELAWVLMKSKAQQRAWLIPNSNNRWAAGRKTVTLPDGCKELESIYIEFGMIKLTGAPIGGRLSIDGLKHRCDQQVGAPQTPDQDWEFLPAFPKPESSKAIIQDEISLVIVPSEGRTATAVVVLLSFLVFFWRQRRNV